MLKNIFKFVFVLALVLFSLNTAFAQVYNPNIYKNLDFGAGNTTLGNTGGGASYTNVKTCVGSGLGNILCTFGKILNDIVPILILLGIVFFVYGVVMYMIADDEEAKTKGKDRIIYGIIGFAVIIGMWGLVNLVVNTFNLQAQNVTMPTAISTTTAAAGGSSCEFKDNPNLQDVVKYIICMIQNAFIPLLFAFATAFFLWGVVQYTIMADSEEAKTKGKDQMIWGIIALAVMLGMWGLVKIVGGTFGLWSDVLPKVSPK